MPIRLSSVTPRSHYASDWTPERIEKLERGEIEQLRHNALELGANDVAALCDAALAGRPKRRVVALGKKNHG
jgi:hypothetical protein